MKHLLLSLGLTLTAAQAAPTTSAPATLSKEGDLMTITLKPEAEQRLRLVTVPVERRAVSAVRLFSGEMVRALASREGQLTPVLGGTLDEALRVADLQAAADGRVAHAQVQCDAAKLALARAETIHRAEAGSARAVEEARAVLAMAEVGLRTARTQRELLGSPPADLSFWVRVAVYSGEAPLLDPAASAVIRTLGKSEPGWTVPPVAGPRTANAATSTIDWYYLAPTDVALRPGERVAVEISVRGSKSEQRVVPFSAVLHDIHGGQWVYEAIAPHTYARRRVQVSRLAGSDAVLASGPAAGAKVVTDGSAELFGTEFMTGK